MIFNTSKTSLSCGSNNFCLIANSGKFHSSPPLHYLIHFQILPCLIHTSTRKKSRRLWDILCISLAINVMSLKKNLTSVLFCSLLLSIFKGFFKMNSFLETIRQKCYRLPITPMGAAHTHMNYVLKQRHFSKCQCGECDLWIRAFSDL